MDRNWFDKLRQFVPPALRADAVVAGGYAVSPQRATDIDIFIIQPSIKAGEIGKLRTIEDDIDQILKYLDDAGIAYEANEHEAYGHQRELVASIPNAYEGKTLQIIATTFPNPKALVDSFDLSVHMLAMRPAPTSEFIMEVTFGTKWTSLRDPIRILRWDTPRETAVRMSKLLARYNLRGNDLELMQLENDALAATVRAAQKAA